VIWFVIAVAFACIPAAIASSKGRPFALWWLFGFFCWLPALIVSLVISDNRTGSPTAWGPGPPSWQAPPPPTTPAGWYPDPGGTASQRYWDGYRWTEHTQ